MKEMSIISSSGLTLKVRAYMDGSGLLVLAADTPHEFGIALSRVDICRLMDFLTFRLEKIA